MRFKDRKKVAWITGSILFLLLLFAGCYVSTYSSSSTYHWNTSQAQAVEDHEVNFPAGEALSLTEAALRGEGILYEVQPDNSLVTLWRTSGAPEGFLMAMLGVQPSYRYAIRVEPEASRRSRIVVALQTVGIADHEVPDYKASTRFDLFKKIDDLAVKYPPLPTTPATGGVQFTLLPHEDLRAFAKRVTGDENNWQQIAKDNNIASPTDVEPFQVLWVDKNLLKRARPAAVAPSAN